MKNKMLLHRFVFFSFFFLLASITPVSAYIGVFSAPVLSVDPEDSYLYFQGPSNLFYKIASDSPEIIIASENALNPIPNPPPWKSFQDRTALFSTHLGGSGNPLASSVNIFSSPAVPGDGWCYFQGNVNSNYRNVNGTLYSLSKIQIDGNNFSTFDNLITTAFAPAVPNDGYIYYFSRVDAGTGRAILQGQNGAAALYKIPTTASSISQATSLGTWGHSAPCAPGNGMIYYQGDANHLLNELLGISTDGTQLTDFRATTLSTPCVGANYQGIPASTLYFQRGDASYYQDLSFVYVNNTNLTSLSSTISTTPYVGADLCLYFLDTGHNMYQLNLVTGVFTNLYIQANSAPTSSNNGDGSITLFFQGTDNKMKKFTPPLSGNLDSSGNLKL